MVLKDALTSSYVSCTPPHSPKPEVESISYPLDLTCDFLWLIQCRSGVLWLLKPCHKRTLSLFLPSWKIKHEARRLASLRPSCCEEAQASQPLGSPPRGDRRMDKKVMPSRAAQLLGLSAARWMQPCKPTPPHTLDAHCKSRLSLCF